MIDVLQDLVKQITAIQWVPIVVVIIFGINRFAKLLESLSKIYQFGRNFTAPLRGRRTSNSELKRQVLETSRNLMDLVQSRQSMEPSFSFEHFHESSESLSRHSRETQNFYVRDYAGKIVFLRQELLKRKLQDRELDNFHEHPTNYIGLRIVAMRLAALAEQLPGET